MIARGLGAIATGGASVTWPGATAPNGWTRSLFKLLALISLAARQGSAEASSFITTLLLCTAGGTLGGMLS